MPLLVMALIALAWPRAARGGRGSERCEPRLEASFTESTASITNRIADLNTFQLINSGGGTVEGFGSATVVVGIIQDRSVTPCGPGSWTNAATRRVVRDGGVLILREFSIACQTAAGPVITVSTGSTGCRAPGSSPAPAVAATSRSTSRHRRPRSPGS